MDLIYATADRVDIGVLQGYELDIAYGADENDFELKTSLDNHVCREDYFIYIDGTEYGGIIDSVAPDTKTNILSYKGRTWHGILNSKVICPDKGHDYLTYNEQDAHEVLRDLIRRLDFSGLFTVREGDCGHEVNGYGFRYDEAYTGICKMLASMNCKLMMKWQGNRVLLWVELIADYSLSEEFDDSQIGMSLQKNYNLPNHIIALGQGDLKDRAVIHLFTNENGGVQPYLVQEGKEPIQDSDYVLDNRHQLLFGDDEYVYKYDYSSAQIKNVPVLTTKEPSDWKTNYTGYYKKGQEKEEDSSQTDAMSGYTQVEKNLVDQYELLFDQPSDWASNYRDYYQLQYDNGVPKKDEGGNICYEAVKEYSEIAYNLVTSQPGDWNSMFYKEFLCTRYYYLSKVEGGKQTWSQVSTTTENTYSPITTKPADWDDNYGSYHLAFWDGTKWSYNNTVSGVEKISYKPQTKQPTDWKTNWKNYYAVWSINPYTNQYYYASLGEHDVYKNKKKAPTWKKNQFYTKYTKIVTPNFSKVLKSAPKGAVYVKGSKEVAPKFSDIQKSAVNGAVGLPYTVTVPPFTYNTYYRRHKDVEVPITWIPNTYYRKYEDRYAELIKGALEKIEELYSSDKIEISIDPTQIYDVGDMIGAYEHVTDIFIAQPITKKIVTIKKNIETIEYEVRKNGS